MIKDTTHLPPNRTARGSLARLFSAAALASVMLAAYGCSSDVSGSGGSGASDSTGSGSNDACGAGTTKCGEACVDTQLDPANCGACGTACAEGEVCSAGQCGLSCAGGTTKCGDACADLKNDPANCGACGTACAEGEVCSNGACGLSCAGGATKCGNACVDTKNDPANCGACGTACAAGEVCSNGACALSCAGGTVKCGNACVDTSKDPFNCGACGASCGPGEVCAAGQCALGCAGGTAKCGNKCVDTNSDDQNCGACGNACAAGSYCAAGTCKAACAPGLLQCDGTCVAVATDPNNCGACGNVCAGGANSDVSCKNGACNLACTPGYGDCDKDAANGCEAPLGGNTANCGACGNVCAGGPNSTPICSTGQCTLACTQNFGNCDGNTANGCETNVLANVAHCGACGNACPAGVNSMPSCVNGVCGVASCSAGYGNCDGNAANGCEADLMNSSANCGACGNACPLGGSCSNGSCAAPLANQILYNGYYYATLDDAPPNAQYGAWINTCQTSYIALPQGWSLAPEDLNVVSNVIATHIWSTHCILFANGVSYGVQTYNGGGACGCSGSQCLSQIGNTYAATSCSRRILIRRPM